MKTNNKEATMGRLFNCLGNKKTISPVVKSIRRFEVEFNIKHEPSVIVPIFARDDDEAILFSLNHPAVSAIVANNEFFSINVSDSINHRTF